MKNTKYILGAALICAIFLTGNVNAASFLEDEAGISAYVNTGSTIDLDSAKAAFQTIEYETDTYIVGSISLSGIEEWEYVHVYVSSDGWIVAYYLKDEPASKIMRWENYNGGAMPATKLEDSISKVSANIGVAYSTVEDDIKYYHFKYPNANRMMLIADRIDVDGTDTFQFKVPTNHTIYEGSWYHYAYDTYGSNTKIDETEVSSFASCNNCIQRNRGFCTSTQTIKGIFHEVSIYHDESTNYNYNGYASVAAALIYQEP